MRFPGRRLRLTVRLDAIAELRRVTGSMEPDPADAAVLADLAGVDGISVRFIPEGDCIQIRDLEILSRLAKSSFTVEVTAHRQAIDEVLRHRLDRVLLISPSVVAHRGERQLAVDIASNPTHYAPLLTRCREGNTAPWVLVDPDPDQVSAARDVGAVGVLLDTSQYAWADVDTAEREWMRLESAAGAAAGNGIRVGAGGGLNRRNVADITAIAELEEVILGYGIAARALFVGFEGAVHEVVAELPRSGEEP